MMNESSNKYNYDVQYRYAILKHTGCMEEVCFGHLIRSSVVYHFGFVPYSGPIAPHGNNLVNLMVTDEKEKADLIAACKGVTMEVSDRGACDVELLMVG
eukprot:1177218-Prorocentrum_minimum.AAC.3